MVDRVPTKAHKSSFRHKDISIKCFSIPALSLGVSGPSEVPAQGVGYVLRVENTEQHFQTLRETRH